MPGLDPGIHFDGRTTVSCNAMDRRVKPGDDNYWDD